ncbi:hypothetical protein FBQ84_04475 [Ignavibacteria bacterium CHB1]|nr:MAG: hypothetical protein EDM69_05475 [Chlorobiota bacterium]MBV6398496.1 hypothetical protein [Ignavibacteria bacterium]MCC6885730.1 hypothetical protein [Ignavibacteriales bacterium]MCE7953075.1 hypothetical protein [Chlorobi bacterium CHB7]MDL1887087.1 hypothetical protein [Ignavibacteria bacterium CHB1]RIK49892.1 MAG: hypothetical protein DCC60_02425 [Ignavibacteriota bacterium]
MINYTKSFFNLRILKLSEILLHEATESNRLRNIYSRIARSRFLMNPVIVGKYGEEYVLIDGANRAGSLKEIGCKLILAQIINYKSPDVKLLTWDHLIYNFDLHMLDRFAIRHNLKYELIEGVISKPIVENKDDNIFATEIESGKTLSIELPYEFFDKIKAITNLTKLYFHKFNFDRSESEISISELRKYSRRNGVLIKFPAFSKQQIMRIARSSHHLPAGISRHIVVNRVLHVKYDIEKLKSTSGIETKQKELEDLLLKKIDSNKVRQYTESVIVFDE